ncbi:MULTISPECIES: GNAT family N-acetyltransferase [unclassified Streptococcus]|uniref:GNAT family N-acetyltransferase n=1 Tax=unclassified Streptococcus TaxID=2608887 RepID=UPI001F0F170D|nr:MULTISPECIES: GNAT family N-acetyltransferase [unclassified Streptococcus]
MALATSKHYRRKGVASLLINHVEQIAQARGCSALALNSGLHEARVGAHLFYEKLGFEKASYDFKRKVNLTKGND